MLKIHSHDWKMCEITIFFTRVYIYRKVYFARKFNLRISKNPIVAQYWGNKINIFTSHQSKTKNKSCFLPVCFDLWLTSFLDICVCKKRWRSVLSNMRDIKCAFCRERGMGASSWMCLQRVILQNYVREKCAFSMMPKWNVLFRWGLKEF